MPAKPEHHWRYDQLRHEILLNRLEEMKLEMKEAKDQCFFFMRGKPRLFSRQFWLSSCSHKYLDGAVPIDV